jgi:uncharacterized membrane protein YgcG
MGGNEMTDFERFIDRGNLTAFMDKGGKDTKFINAIFAALGIPVTAEGLTKFFDGIAKMLPEESEEVKRIRKFYATEGKDYMDPSKPNYIPGMENYNIVYGNIFDPQSGLQDAFKDRMDTIANTLGSASYMAKHWDTNLYGPVRGLTKAEIRSILDGTYKGPVTPLTKRYKDLDTVSTLEFNFKYDDDKIDTSKLIDPAGGETITGPNIDEEAGRPDDPSGGGSFDPGFGFVDQGGYGEFGPPPKDDDKPKDDNKGSGGSGGSGGFGGADFGSGTGKYGGV